MTAFLMADQRHGQEVSHNSKDVLFLKTLEVADHHRTLRPIAPCVSAPLPVWLREVLVENVLKLFHDVVHVDGDQAAVLLQRLFKNTLKTSNNTKI